MAAGAYKGLTIRIGADTTKLASALRGANSVIYNTQKQINTLNKALRLDPGNANAAAMQVGAIASQATNAAAKMDLLRRGIGELATTNLVGRDGTVAELAQSTDNAALAAEHARVAYLAVNEELASLYAEIKETTSGMVDLREVTNSGSFNQTYLDGLLEEKKITQEQYEAIMRLKPAWTEARNALDNYTDVKRLGEMNAQFVEAQAHVKHLAREYASLKMRSDLSQSLQELDGRITLVSAATETARDRFERLNSAANLDPTNIGLAAQRADALAEATEAASTKAKLLKEKIEAYKADGIGELANKVENVERAFHEAEAEVARAKTALEEYRGRADASEDETKRLADALNEAERAARDIAKVAEFRDLKDELAETASQANALKKAMSEAASVRAAAVQAAAAVGDLMRDAGRAIIEHANKIDTAYRNVRKTVDATEEQYQRLYDSAVRFSQTHITSASTMLEMEALAGQVGVGADALEHFAEVAANLDVATDIEAEDIALKMGQMVNVMNDLDEGGVERFADALVRLGNNMPAQESAIMNVAQRISAVGGIAGMSTPEVLAWGSAVASTGQNSEAAATALSNTISAIEVAVGVGGKDLQAFADISKVSAEDFANAWKSSPTEALSLFIQGLKNLDEADDSAIAALENMGITGVRQQQTLLGLSQTLDNLDDALTMSQDAWDGVSDKWGAAGDAAREAERKSEGFSGSLAKMQNSSEALAASFGSALVPYMDMAADVIRNLTSWLNGMDDGTKAATVGVGGLFAAISVAEPVLGALGNSWKEIIDSMKSSTTKVLGKLATKFGDTTVEVTGLSSALESLMNTGALGVGGGLAVAVTVLAMFATAALDAHQKTQRFNDAISDMNDDVKTARESLASGARDVESYSSAARRAVVNIDDLVESFEAHSKSIEDTRKAAQDSIGMLGQYKRVIDEAAAGGEQWGASADNVAKLEWALRGLNEAAGTSYTAEQVLIGAYEDEQGVIHNTIEEIDNLIAKRQEEARVQAYQDMYTEAYKAQTEAANQLAAAQAVLAEGHDNYIDKYMKLNHWSREYAEQQWQESKECANLTENVNNLTSAYNAAVGRADGYAAAMTSAAEATAKNANEIQQWVASNSLVEASLLQFGNDINKTIATLEQHGVTVEDISRLTETEFMEMAASCGGSIDQLIAKLLEYRATDPGNKKSDFTVTGNGADGSATRSIRDYRNENPGPSKTAVFEVVGAQALRDALNTFRLVKQEPNELFKKVSLAATLTTGGNARGGYLPQRNIPKHADGFIATRPTLTQYGWIGEDGAEAYSGGSLVPLTNRKYSMPYIDQISDSVVEKLLSNLSSAGIIDYALIGASVAQGIADADMGVAIDKRALVGAIAPDMERELGRIGRMGGW